LRMNYIFVFVWGCCSIVIDENCTSRLWKQPRLVILIIFFRINRYFCQGYFCALLEMQVSPSSPGKKSKVFISNSSSAGGYFFLITSEPL